VAAKPVRGRSESDAAAETLRTGWRLEPLLDADPVGVEGDISTRA
jgi:hypothetical protein